MLDEVARGEVVEKELDLMIERRSRGADPDEREELWMASVRRYHERHRRERAAVWYAYHLDQADRIRRTMTALVEAHEEKAAALLREEPGVA